MKPEPVPSGTSDQPVPFSPSTESPEKYQVAGVDPRERGFNRPVECERSDLGYRAVLRYETLRVTAPAQPTQAGALQALIHLLHEQGYRQLRSQLSFRGTDYLGSREPWIDYQDPTPTATGWWARLKQWCGRGNGSTSTEH